MIPHQDLNDAEKRKEWIWKRGWLIKYKKKEKRNKINILQFALFLFIWQLFRFTLQSVPFQKHFSIWTEPDYPTNNVSQQSFMIFHYYCWLIFTIIKGIEWIHSQNFIQSKNCLQRHLSDLFVDPNHPGCHPNSYKKNYSNRSSRLGDQWHTHVH